MHRFDTGRDDLPVFKKMMAIVWSGAVELHQVRSSGPRGCTTVHESSPCGAPPIPDGEDPHVELLEKLEGWGKNWH
jgi:hypothetical protein